MLSRYAFRLVLLACVACIAIGCTNQPSIDLQRVPDNGVHPRIITDAQGITHLLYFRADAPDADFFSGNLYYRQLDQTTQGWKEAVKVSTEPFDFKDPIYRAGFSVDGEGRVHVVWLMDRPATYFYARSDTNRTAFEPQRQIVDTNLEGIDAGADIATFENKVAIVWAAGDLRYEDQRNIYMRQSTDFGETFGNEIALGDRSLGACACCGLTANYNQTGDIVVAYRSAINGTGRHMQVLTATVDANKSVEPSYLPLDDSRNWDLAACPVTTNDIVEDYEGNSWLIFENQSRIAKMNFADGGLSEYISEQPSQTREKHPAMAFNRDGNLLIAWGEGAGFFNGGALRWALFDDEGKHVPGSEMADVEVTDRSSPAVLAKPDGNFLILY